MSRRFGRNQRRKARNPICGGYYKADEPEQHICKGEAK